jgi:hypothetical protein
METPNMFYSVLSHFYLPAVPEIVVWLTGLISAFRRRRDHPKVSKFVMASCGMSLVLKFSMPWIAPRVMGFFGFCLLLFPLTQAALFAIPIGLLLHAVFVDRWHEGAG